MSRRFPTRVLLAGLAITGAIGAAPQAAFAGGMTDGAPSGTYEFNAPNTTVESNRPESMDKGAPSGTAEMNQPDQGAVPTEVVPEAPPAAAAEAPATPPAENNVSWWRRIFQ